MCIVSLPCSCLDRRIDRYFYDVGIEDGIISLRIDDSAKWKSKEGGQ